MTITTTRSDARRRGFTLTEVLIAASLGSMVLAGVMSTFLMLARSGANVANYSMMESQSRRALEELSQDIRMASDVTWNSATSITLLVPDNYTSTSNRVTYAFDDATDVFFRMPGIASATNAKTTLISNVSSFTYTRFDRIDNASTSDVTTKRIQLSMIVRSTTRTTATASNNILSASFILRNKPTN
jgi:prepilin-type N-terminal cleavage/methylation domain-containing protein